MTGYDYQNLAMRTDDSQSYERLFAKIATYGDGSPDPGALINGALGLTGEAGEAADLIKKYIFHGHTLDRYALVKELGDVCWYVALICAAMGWDFDEILKLNIEKLKKRYPEGFTEAASRDRND